jgi:hypothetical protein
MELSCCNSLCPGVMVEFGKYIPHFRNDKIGISSSVQYYLYAIRRLIKNLPFYRTSYDGGKKQHWLSVYKDGTLERFLMKDVLARSSLSEAAVNSVVRASVDKLICQVDAWDQQTKK